MSGEALLDQAVATILAKARQREQEQSPTRPRPATLNFQFSGGGIAIDPLVADPQLLEIPWPGKILYAHMYAGDADGQPVAVSATISVIITRVTTFGGTLALYGSTIPSLSGSSATTLDVSTWVSNLVPGDALIAKLESFTGDATWLSLNMLLYPTDVPQGTSTLVDDGGGVIVDDNGNRVVLRN